MSNLEISRNVKSYTAFPALFAVFLAFAIGYGLQLANLVRQNTELRRAEASSLQAVPRARLVGAKLQGVTKDLLELAPASAGARQVVSEFEIRAAPPAR